MKKIIKHKDGRTQVINLIDDVSKTDQSQKQLTDINHIMRKYHATGMVTHLQNRQGSYVDVTKIKNYQSSLQTVIDANNSFMTLSSQVRKKFNNDPQELVKFLADPKNKDEAISLGLINKPQIVEQTKTEGTKKTNDDSNDDKK